MRAWKVLRSSSNMKNKSSRGSNRVATSDRFVVNGKGTISEYLYIVAISETCAIDEVFNSKCCKLPRA